MENLFVNLTRGQIQNLFPVRLPCICETYSRPRYDIELQYRVGHKDKWVKTVAITCRNCGSSITHNVEAFMVTTREINF